MIYKHWVFLTDFSILDYCMEDFPIQKFDLQTGCNKPDRCKCDLSAIYKGSQSFSQIVGKKQTHTLGYEISNTGSEPGYDAAIRFSSTEVELPSPNVGSSNVLQCYKVMNKYSSFFWFFQNIFFV